MADGRVDFDVGANTGPARDELGRFIKGSGKQGKAAGTAFGSGFSLGLGPAFAALAAFSGLRKIGSDILSFEQALAEITTITSDLAVSQDELTQSLIQTSIQFGTSAQDQAKTFYQIISAGITDVVGANEVLIASNKLAIGGLAGVEESVDILTSAINSFGSENLSATKAADILFGTVRLGKTRITELSSSLGQILPSASALGVSFEDTNAALAALTTRGVSTSEAVTQLNAVFTAVLKKQDAAKKILGENAEAFSLQALSTKGLTKFLKDLNVALGGSEQKLVKLLGRAEGARAIITLAGDDFKTMANNVSELENSAGAADEAFQKMSATLSFQLQRSLSTITAGFQKLGSASGGPLVAGLTTLNDRLGGLFDAAVSEQPLKALTLNFQLFIKDLELGIASFRIFVLDQFIALAKELPAVFASAFNFFDVLPDKAKTSLATIARFNPVLSTALEAFGALEDVDIIDNERVNENLKKVEESSKATLTALRESVLAERTALAQELAGLTAGEGPDAPTPDTAPEFVGPPEPEEDPLQDRIDAVKEKTADLLGTVQEGFAGTFNLVEEGSENSVAALETLTERGLKNLSKIGASFSKGFARSFAAVGAALVTGKNALEEFGKALLGVLGDIAIQAGTEIFLIGLGLFNPQQVATGLALIALGGALKSLSGGAGGAGSGPGSASSGEFAPIQPGEDIDEADMRRPATQVNVRIDGVVTDPSGIAAQISELLEEFQDGQGGEITSTTSVA